MADWDPAQYLKFAEPRLRPAIDLLNRIEIDRPGRVVDLGCGTGTLTRLLAARWPEARVTGVDSSPAMLSRAADPTVTWQRADLSAWAPEEPWDVIVSNAALHWLGDHGALLPRLVDALAPGGVLAVQMPRNFGEPSHTAIDAAAEETGLSAAVEPHLLRAPVSEPEFYADVLAPRCADLDIWETTYLHRLKGDHPVAEWTRGTVLAPVLAALSAADGRRLEAAYVRRVDAAYPPRPDGTTLFPFRRLFLVARRAPQAT